ncbi:MAG TPA: TRC40/GET3/ArsA family transport-energizing ATPase [Solirubrobacteraceae bacterium]|jgi:arsenite-transporting ATPase|nr:TRC40/GET3/ArsA family transport-energizing ATPase [Solirubrobacteraceae bacterium]
MVPRTILYTGKGGVGKTSVAAATARRCAARGQRTVILSTDPAHSLSDSLGVSLGDAPTPVSDNLWGQEINAQQELERNWSAVQDWLGDMLIERGVDRISAEELTVPPGLDELFSLLSLRQHHESGDYEVVIVDCAPTGETLRLLSFPDVARWWLEKIFPQQNQIMAAARPFARAVLDVSLPGEAVLEDVQRLVSNLIAMNEILRDRERVTIRLVMNPDRLVIDEARRTFTYLNLYGFLTDAVIVNRVFPEQVGDYFGAWRRRQQEHLVEVEAAFSPVPVLRAPYFDQEVVGSEMLDRLGSTVFDELDPAAVLHDRLTHRLEVGPHQATLSLDLPFVERTEVSLKKIGLELVVKVDGQKRTIMLPPALAEYRPGAAALRDGILRVTFSEPEPVAAGAGGRRG